MGKERVIAGRTAVITGAASGMGRAVAQLMSRRGSPVVICDWNEDGLRETAASLTGPVLQKKVDVRDRHALMVLAAETQQWMPEPLGLVLNNAGVTVSQTVAHASPEDDDWVLDVNWGGVMHGNRAFLPIMLEQGSGVIANTSSVFGLIGYPTQAAYCASKHAVRGWTESLRHELRDTGVSAVCIHPGGVDTDIVTNARFHEDDLGNTDRSIMERDFKKVARTSSEKAAEIIVGGIEKGKHRILVGPDAVFLGFMLRFVPVRYYDVMKRFEPLVRR